MLEPEVFQFFHAIGIDLTPSYSVPECPVCTIQTPADVSTDGIGQPVLGHEVMISPAGEILVRGPSLFHGYYKDRDATNLKLRDGWFYTGDTGVINDKGQIVTKGQMSNQMDRENMVN